MKTHIERLNLEALEKQEKNARFMSNTMFKNLVENLRHDGALTSVPLVRPTDKGHKILSGHHRIAAAIEAGITEADCMVLDEDVTREQEVAIVLSHNSLSGQDDPATLLQMYAELDATDWQEYSGLDDEALELLEEVTTEPLGEVNLDYRTVTIVFLPHELEQAEAAFLDAKKINKADEMWAASIQQADDVMHALETVALAHGIQNTAVSMLALIKVFENHYEDLKGAWLDEDGEPRRTHKKVSRVPIETVLGTRAVQGKWAARIDAALKRAKKKGEMPEGGPWEMLALMAENYLQND